MHSPQGAALTGEGDYTGKAQEIMVPGSIYHDRNDGVEVMVDAQFGEVVIYVHGGNVWLPPDNAMAFAKAIEAAVQEIRQDQEK